MADVTWLTHPIYADYQASSDGRIRSVDHLVRCSRGGGMRMCYGRERVTSPLRNGYLALVLSVDSVFVNVRVHRFVCETFHGLAPNPTSVVRHLNGIQTDNRPENPLQARARIHAGEHAHSIGSTEPPPTVHRLPEAAGRRALCA